MSCWGDVQTKLHYTFIHIYTCTFPLNLPQRTRKKRISTFSGHRGYAVSMFCLCSMFNQTYRKHYAWTAQNSCVQAINEFCRHRGNNYIAIALQRVGQGCPLRTFPSSLWTWTKRTPWSVVLLRQNRSCERRTSFRYQVRYNLIMSIIMGK